MGFRVPRRTALITFEGTDYDGAEIECRLDVPVAVLFEFQRLNGDGDAAESTFRRWGDEILLTWNLQDEDGVPLPATGEGVLELPGTMIAMIMTRWSEAAAGVPGPLGRPSPVGAM